MRAELAQQGIQTQLSGKGPWRVFRITVNGEMVFERKGWGRHLPSVEQIKEIIREAERGTDTP